MKMRNFKICALGWYILICHSPQRGLLLTLALLLPLNFGCDHQRTGADATATAPANVTSLGSTASDSIGATAPTTAGPAEAQSSSSSSQPAPVQAPSGNALRPAGRTVDSTFDDLKFDMEKTERFDRSMLTSQIEQLFGKKIRIRGYIFPTLRKRGLKQFVLVRDNLECCFGAGAALYDCILVRMQANKTAEYTIRPVTVEGIFRFEEILGPEGKHLAIFCLDGEGVE